MKQTWIVVCNSELAQIFLLKNHELSLLYQLEHKESKEKVSELVSDKAGRGISQGWNEQYSLNEGQNLLRHERIKFAIELFHLCKKGFDEHHFQNMIIFSSPKFLGDIRNVFKPLFAHCPSKEIDKELPSYWTIDEKVNYMSNFLEIPLKVAR